MSAMAAGAAAKELVPILAGKGDQNALVLTGQHTVEEYESIISTFVNDFKSKKVYHWINNKDSFDQYDGMLIRGDKNPNTKGLLKAFEKHGITAVWTDLQKDLKSSAIKNLVVVGPENVPVYPEYKERIKEFSSVENLIFLTAAKVPAFEELETNVWLIPLKTFVEKEGTFVNFSGIEQKFKKVTTIVSEALTVTEAAELMSGKQLMVKPETNVFVETKRPVDTVMLEHRKKNEFVFKRGQL